MLIIGKEYLSLYTSIQPHVYIHIDEEESGGEYGKNIMRPSSLSWSLASVLGPVLRASFFFVLCCWPMSTDICTTVASIKTASVHYNFGALTCSPSVHASSHWPFFFIRFGTRVFPALLVISIKDPTLVKKKRTVAITLYAWRMEIESLTPSLLPHRFLPFQLRCLLLLSLYSAETVVPRHPSSIRRSVVSTSRHTKGAANLKDRHVTLVDRHQWQPFGHINGCCCSMIFPSRRVLMAVIYRDRLISLSQTCHQ